MTGTNLTAPGSNATPRRELIFSEGSTPFGECHASTLVRLDDGRFLVAFFAGTKEGDDDVAVYLAEGKPGNWSMPRRVAKVANVAHWNPVLHHAPDGRIILYFKVGATIERWQTWVMESVNDGRDWSVPRELIPGDAGGRGPVKNKLLVLSDGTWLAPASLETGARWDAFVDRSTDGGQTWRATHILALDRQRFPGKGVIQPTLWESEPGKVHMLLRSTTGRICRSDSNDYGLSWSKVYRTQLPSNNSGIDLARLSDGALILAYNPVSGNWAVRHPLTLAVSTDNGESWRKWLDLETGKGEYSYPAIISFGDRVAVTYTWNRRSVAFWLSES